jgi:hypothetical protein
VFLTFSLSEFGMSRFWIQHRKEHAKEWYRHLPVHLTGLTLCVTILAVTVMEKFGEGGWLTLIITMALVGLCVLVKRHYRLVGLAIRAMDKDFPAPHMVAGSVESEQAAPNDAPSPSTPVAILFVGGYGGLGRHAMLTLLRMFPGHFKGVVFVSVAVVDSDVFKGAQEVSGLEVRTREQLQQYERFGQGLGLATASAFAIGTEVAVEAEKLAIGLYKKYPQALAVAGQLVFEEDTLWTRVLHNETAFLVQRRLQHAGVPMVVLPVRLNLERAQALRDGGSQAAA